MGMQRLYNPTGDMNITVCLTEVATNNLKQYKSLITHILSVNNKSYHLMGW